MVTWSAPAPGERTDLPEDDVPARQRAGRLAGSPSREVTSAHSSHSSVDPGLVLDSGGIGEPDGASREWLRPVQQRPGAQPLGEGNCLQGQRNWGCTVAGLPEVLCVATRAVRAILSVLGCASFRFMAATPVLGSSLHGVDDELGAIVNERGDDIEEPTAAVETGPQLR